MKGIIYKAENIINGKVYIGQTIRGLKLRIKGHENTVKEKRNYFQHAIQKSGKENFQWEIIDKADNKEDLNLKEKKWIKFYDSTNSEKGYNLTIGGGGVSYKENPVIQYDLNFNFIREYDSIAEVSATLGIQYSLVRASCVGSSATVKNFIFLYKDEYKKTQEILEEIKKRKELSEKFSYDTKPRKVIGFNKERERFYFESIYKASLETGVPEQAVAEICRLEMISAKGYIFFFVEDVPSETSFAELIFQINLTYRFNIMRNSKAVKQYDFSGELVGIFKNVRELKKSFPHIHSSTIHKCCKGVTHSGGGYIWIYEGTEDENEILKEKLLLRRNSKNSKRS